MPTDNTSTVSGICDNYLRMDGDMRVENNALEDTSLRFMSLPAFNIHSTPLLSLETIIIYFQFQEVIQKLNTFISCKIVSIFSGLHF